MDIQPAPTPFLEVYQHLAYIFVDPELCYNICIAINC